MLIVTSHAEHVELRSAHRRAYPRSELLRLGLRRVFLLARPVRRGGAEGDARDAYAWVDGALRDEARRFSDIVQGDFIEAYRLAAGLLLPLLFGGAVLPARVCIPLVFSACRNLTYKHTMGLEWAARYCPQAQLVIKMDDDIAVDLYQLMDYMHGQVRAVEINGTAAQGESQ